MTWTEDMEEEYVKAVDWHIASYYDDIEEYKIELREECKKKLAEIKEDIENGWIE